MIACPQKQPGDGPVIAYIIDTIPFVLIAFPGMFTAGEHRAETVSQHIVKLYRGTHLWSYGICSCGISEENIEFKVKKKKKYKKEKNICSRQGKTDIDIRHGMIYLRDKF